jgi:hypothetical protein
MWCRCLFFTEVRAHEMAHEIPAALADCTPQLSGIRSHIFNASHACLPVDALALMTCWENAFS